MPLLSPTLAHEETDFSLNHSVRSHDALSVNLCHSKEECITEMSPSKEMSTTITHSEYADRIPILYSFQYQNPNDIKHIIHAIIQKDECSSVESQKIVIQSPDDFDIEIDQVQRIQNIHNWRTQLMAKYS